MAENRIRRWFQFGVMDVLILTTVAAAVTVLCRPVKVEFCRALPWVCGAWETDGGMLALWPDRTYIAYLVTGVRHENGSGWTISPHGTVEGAFFLEFGETRWLIRRSDDGETIDHLNADGGFRERLRPVLRFEGPLSGGAPHGTWTVLLYSQTPKGLLEYRNGDLIDLQDESGTRNLEWLNLLRSARELPPLTKLDFADKSTAEEKAHE